MLQMTGLYTLMSVTIFRKQTSDLKQTDQCESIE